MEKKYQLWKINTYYNGEMLMEDDLDLETAKQHKFHAFPINYTRYEIREKK